MKKFFKFSFELLQQKIWRNSWRSMNPLFTDPNNPTWGWSWLERWMAAQQWGDVSSSIVCGKINKANAQFNLSSETNSPTASRSESRRYTFQPLSTPYKQRLDAEAKQLKPSSTRKISVPDDYFEDSARFEPISEANYRTPSRSESRRYTYQSPSTPSRRKTIAERKELKASTARRSEIEEHELTSEANSPTASRSESHRYTFPSISTSSPRRSAAGATKSKQSGARNSSIPDDDSQSLASLQSTKSLRYSNGGGPRSSAWDDESETSSSILPSYMTFTESARAKSKVHAPFEMEKNGAREMASFSSSGKKRLLYPPSPARSGRNSGHLNEKISRSNGIVVLNKSGALMVGRLK